MSWNIIAQFTFGKRFGFQSAESIRQNLITNISRRVTQPLGGSRAVPNSPVFNLDLGTQESRHNHEGPHNAYDYVDVEIDGTNMTGVTFVARVQVRVSDPLMTITPKIRNVTDSTDAGVGVACSACDEAYAGTNQKQAISLTIASGVKTYRLMYTVNLLSGDSWCKGEIISYATA
jgi:hypothetical protein